MVTKSYFIIIINKPGQIALELILEYANFSDSTLHINNLELGFGLVYTISNGYGRSWAYDVREKKVPDSLIEAVQIFVWSRSESVRNLYGPKNFFIGTDKMQTSIC